MLGVTAIVQRWQDQQPVETIVRKPDKPLPGVKELNAKIPESEWEKSQIDGKPRPPWQHQEVVYLLDPASAEKFTFASGTVGAHIAVERLRDRVIWMRQLRGENVVPVVELANKPMKIKVGGKKLRPEFLIVGWSVLGVGLTSDATPQIEHAPLAVSSRSSRLRFPKNSTTRLDFETALAGRSRLAAPLVFVET